MRHELESAKIASLVATEFLLWNIADIFDNFSQMLWWHVRFLGFHKPGFALLSESVVLKSEPFSLFLRELRSVGVGRRSIAWWRGCWRKWWWSRRAPARRRRRYRRHDWSVTERDQRREMPVKGGGYKSTAGEILWAKERKWSLKEEAPRVLLDCRKRKKVLRPEI